MCATTRHKIRVTSAIGVTLALWLVGAVPPPSDAPQGPAASEAAAEPPTMPEIPEKDADLVTDKGEKPSPPQAVPVPVPVPDSPATVAPAKALEPSPPSPKVEETPLLSEEDALRAKTAERLSKLPKIDDNDAKSADKSLREVLEARLRLLDGWKAAVKERNAAESPQPSPEDEAADLKIELERTKAQIAAASKDRKTLVPPSFRNLPANVPESTRNEIKEAISNAEAELKETSAKFEEIRSQSSSSKGKGDNAAAIRAGRDKQIQKIAGLKAKIQEREKAVVEAINPETREPAREKLLNARWELTVESERLKAMDANLSLIARRATVTELTLRGLEAHVSIATQSLQVLKNLHRTLSVREEQSLQQAAVIEKSRADKVEDPLERYRAKRSAELLELQATVLADENALTLNPPPTFDEQHMLAIHAETDLSNVKHLLDDGRVSHLDALRLNNDFRRIGIERERIEKSEMARTASRLANAENALSRVEIEIVYDGRDDRFELDNLLERLPKPLHPKLIAMFEEFEREHMKLLNRRQIALEKLATRAEETHDQVIKRLRILDEHFGFIRTHIFWVRDEEPVSLLTFSQANRETVLVARAMIRLIAEFGDRSLWGRFSPEFIIAAMGVVVLPWPLHRLSRSWGLSGDQRPAGTERSSPK